MVLEFRFCIQTSARECQSRRKVNTGVKVNTGIFAKGGPFVDLENQNFRACGKWFEHRVLDLHTWAYTDIGPMELIIAGELL